LTFGEKSAKNRLEYRSEPTSLRLRNRPEIKCRAASDVQSIAF
jgi:hypothetical protein